MVVMESLRGHRRWIHFDEVRRKLNDPCTVELHLREQGLKGGKAYLRTDPLAEFEFECPTVCIKFDFERATVWREQCCFNGCFCAPECRLRSNGNRCDDCTRGFNLTDCLAQSTKAGVHAIGGNQKLMLSEFLRIEVRGRPSNRPSPLLATNDLRAHREWATKNSARIADIPLMKKLANRSRARLNRSAIRKLDGHRRNLDDLETKLSSKRSQQVHRALSTLAKTEIWPFDNKIEASVAMKLSDKICSATSEKLYRRPNHLNARRTHQMKLANPILDALQPFHLEIRRKYRSRRRIKSPNMNAEGVPNAILCRMNSNSCRLQQRLMSEVDSIEVAENDRSHDNVRFPLTQSS